MSAALWARTATDAIPTMTARSYLRLYSVRLEYRPSAFSQRAVQSVSARCQTVPLAALSVMMKMIAVMATSTAFLDTALIVPQ